MNGCETMKCEFWDGEICTYPPQVCRYRESEEDTPPSVPVKELEQLINSWKGERHRSASHQFTTNGNIFICDLETLIREAKK